MELTISTLKTRNTGLALTVDRLKSSATEEDYEALRASHEAMTAAHSKLNATHRDTSAKLKALEKKSERLSYDLNIATEGYTEAVKLLAAKPTDEVTNASDGKLDRESVSLVYLVEPFQS